MQLPIRQICQCEGRILGWAITQPIVCNHWMIKIISYVVIAFATGRQISYIDGPIFYSFSTGKRACVTAADLIDWDEKLHCFPQQMSSCDIKFLLCFSAGALQESRGCSLYERTAVGVLLQTDNLHLLDCAVTWSLLTRTDTDWTCWLTVDSRVLKHKHRFETDRQWPPRTPVVHYLQTVHCWLLLRQRWQNSCILSRWRHHILKKCYLRDFKKLPNQNSIDIPMQTSKALFVANSKVSMNAYLVRICTSRSNKDGRERYVLFFKITSEIKT